MPISSTTLCKQPSEKITFSMDFTNYVSSSSITLSNPQVSHTRYDGGAGDLTLGSPSISGQKVIFTIDGGTTNVRYKVTVKVDASDGTKLEGDGILLVKDY